MEELTQEEFEDLKASARRFTTGDVAKQVMKAARDVKSGEISETFAHNIMNILMAQAKWLQLEGFCSSDQPELEPMEYDDEY